MFLLLPLVALGSRLATNDARITSVYAYGMFLWALYHQTRQHYGFLAIYIVVWWKDTRIPALGSVIYFGIVGHHFYLDQRIWRPSKQPELRDALGVRGVDPGTLRSPPPG